MLVYRLILVALMCESPYKASEFGSEEKRCRAKAEEQSNSKVRGVAAGSCRFCPCHAHQSGSVVSQHYHRLPDMTLAQLVGHL